MTVSEFVSEETKKEKRIYDEIYKNAGIWK